METELLWTPSRDRIESSLMTRFMRDVSNRRGIDLPDYAAFHRWSTGNIEDFWRDVWAFCGVVGDAGERTVADRDAMPGARYFPDGRICFAENLLKHSAGMSANDQQRDALVFWGEDKIRRRMSHGALLDSVSQAQQAFAAAGIGPGDRICAVMPNMPEVIVGMLAASSLGAVWSSCSPDFGVQGIVDRFGQIEPKLLVAVDGYFYNGKTIPVLDKIAQVAARIPSVGQVVVVPYIEVDQQSVERSTDWRTFIGAHSAKAPTFARMPFNHPLYILFSSGTTGVPKCIVHGQGGVLLQHVKEQQLHCDVQPGDRLFYFTTCGWMMWNWLASCLASGATLLLYDGSPFLDSGRVLWDFAQAERMTHFGTSAKYIDALKKSGLKPIDGYDLSSIRSVLSTGSPLAPESFSFVYEGIKNDVCLSSMSGGTDLCASFVGGNPILPVWRGEIQCKLLGMAVAAFDDDGKPFPEGQGQRGELVCTRSFPSMPLGFWNDPGDAKYRAAYYEQYPGVWCHGDYIEITEHGGAIIYGRSDAVLNPGGVPFQHSGIRSLEFT